MKANLSAFSDVMLYGFVSRAATSRYACVRLSNGTTAYKVPSGFYFFVKNFSTFQVNRNAPVTSPTDHAELDGSLGYGDSDVGFSSTTAPTNAVFIGSFTNEWGAIETTLATVATPSSISAESASWSTTLGQYIPEGKFIFVYKNRRNSAGGFIIAGGLVKK